MFSQPLDLGRFIRTRTDSKLEVVPILDILIIVLFFGIFSSAFVFPQGVEVDLELTEELVSGMEVTAVLTVRRDDMLLFEGQNLKLSQFKGKAVAFLKGREKAALLVRLDPSIRAQTVFDIFGQAKQAGFSHVLVAGENQAIEVPTFH